MEPQLEPFDNSINILIAEDSPTQAEQLRHLLETRGFKVRTASNGRRALALAHEQTPTLLISDIVMPEMDGYALCKEIKAHEGLKAVPVILVTSLSSTDDIIRGLECGADSFVRKPYEDRYFLSRIEYTLANRRLGERTKMQLGVEISFGGRKYFITSERQQILDLLISTYEEAVHMNEELGARQKELDRAYKSLKGLYRIAESLIKPTTIQQVLETTLERALELPGIRAGWISLREGESGFRLAASCGLPPALQTPSAMEGDCLCRRKLLAGELDSVTNILECERLQRGTGDTWGLRCHASVPLWIKDQVVGVMNLAGPDEGMIAEQDLKTLYGIGNQIAVAIERADLYAKLEQKVAERTQALKEEFEERGLVEEALRLSEERFRKVFEEGPMGMALVAPNLRIMSSNEALCQILGYTSNELKGKTIAEITHPEDIEEDVRMARTLFAGGIPGYRIEKRFITKSGKTVWVNLTASVIRAENNDPLFGLGIVEDVTERKQLELQFLQAQKMEAVGRLAGGIAHDFNNLLTVINGYSQLLLERLDPKNLSRGPIEEIQKAGVRAASLTRQLLAFGRKQILAPQVTDLNVIVSEIEKMLRRLIGEDIELRAVLGPNLGKVRVDTGQVEQVLTNLVLNARDAMPQGGRITIETSDVDLDATYVRTHLAVAAGRYVMLAVSDTGHGMDAETQSHIFEPFFTTKEAGKGTGLGLATVYGIVKQSGGYIWVYSEPGEGTVFKIYLPRVEETQAAEEERRPSSPAPGGKETILVAEDQDAVRILICEVLTSKGYRILVASRGEEALRIAREHPGPIHLLVTDVVMPGISGRELARNLAVLQPELKVLYMSGYTGNAMVHHGMLEEGLIFIQKPFSPDALARKVREVLEKL